MKYLNNKFIKDGQFTGVSIWICGIGGASLLLGTILYASSLWIAVVGLSLGGILLGLGTYASKAQTLGLHPFTNDPLNWRKAKASYRNKERAEDSAKETSEPNDETKPRY